MDCIERVLNISVYRGTVKDASAKFLVTNDGKTDGGYLGKKMKVNGRVIGHIVSVERPTVPDFYPLPWVKMQKPDMFHLILTVAMDYQIAEEMLSMSEKLQIENYNISW